ncbi:TolC family outer membrane protein [Massilia agri]|uniref:TolC family outer membrane protein n=1 Tax=Massilia agri TaxID=1886785 RepID=A0ABT2AMA0_9BURK|nr:TolC family outer membrane protein [Massilia agri]MCS0597290.1 TolC family outer membrane protein [Massilia agri]
MRTPSMKLLPAVLGMALAAVCSQASAIGLLEAYDLALKNDPAFRSAVYANEAGKENRILGRSNLLPSASASYGVNKAKTVREINERRAPDEDYISRSTVVQVRQPLVNFDALARYRQGVAQSNYAAAQFESQEQNIILRVAEAYFDALFQADQVALARAERDVYSEQRNVNNRLFKNGEGTRTDMLETQSRLDVAEAALIEAQNNRDSALDVLAGIIGGHVDGLDQLRPGLRAESRDVPDFEEWKKTAMRNNPDIQTLQYGVQVATEEIRKQRAGHLPRLDVVASYNNGVSDTTSTINQDLKTRSIGLQLNVPIYSGGGISAATRQAAANKGRAVADLETQINQVLVELRRQYKLTESSVPRIDALIKAVDSAELLVKATEQSIKGGVRINLDVLNAQRQLSLARRDLAQARYGYLLAQLRLKAAAGTLGREDVRMIAGYFE